MAKDKMSLSLSDRQHYIITPITEKYSIAVKFPPIAIHPFHIFYQAMS